MHVRELGDPARPVVVLMHGQVFGPEVFAGLPARLAKTRRVLALDMPGYGASPLPKPYSVEAARRMVAGELARRGVKKADLVGFSLGGYQALALALEKPFEVTRLALLGAAGGMSAEEKAAFAGFAAGIRANALPLGDVAVARFHAPAFAKAHPELAARTAKWAEAAPKGALADECEAMSRPEFPDLRPRLGALAIPALVRCGAEDAATPPDGQARPIAAGIPGATLEVVPGAGHLLLVEDEAATIDSIARFLQA